MQPPIIKYLRVVDKIKEGSIGTIYKVVNLDNKVLALKLLHPRLSARSDKRKLFKKEATVAKKLNHYNIIKVYDYYDAKPQPYFTMEYFPSENLKEVARNHPKRIKSKEFCVLIQLGEALQYIHSKGIVHMDVKPENVLINVKNEVKLADFSISITPRDRMLWFLHHKVSGTPSYMSPEQIREDKVDHRTDIYSFGVLAYELFTGLNPFTGPTIQATLQRHLQMLAPAMEVGKSTFPFELDDLIHKLLSKDPAQRPDIGSVIYDLAKLEKKLYPANFS